LQQAIRSSYRATILRRIKKAALTRIERICLNCRTAGL
jgi:hypothetical protein